MTDPQYGDIVRGRFGRTWVLLFIGMKDHESGWFVVLSDDDPVDRWETGKIIDGPISLLLKNCTWLPRDS